ncbi:MAG: NAD-dependent dehydratase, partial [Bacteroidales bacterium]
VIAKYDKKIGDSLLGDKTHSMIFDNSKIKSIVPEFEAKTPFSQGAKEIATWYMAHKEMQFVDQTLDAMFDTMIRSYKKL